MSDANTTALAALLASHPDECAAVVALLATGGSGAWHFSHIAKHVQSDNLRGILLALASVSIVTGLAHDRWVPPGNADRYSIARMGAAAWLRERCPPAPPSPSFDECEQASRDRLCDIHAMAVHYKHPTARAIRSILIGAANSAPVGRDKYRRLLVRIGAYGVPLDVDAEVAKVWEPQP